MDEIVKYLIGVLSFGEEISVSDLTPDGDLFSDARVAIRSFLSSNPNGLTESELALMADMARNCQDPANMIRLRRLMDGLSIRA